MTHMLQTVKKKAVQCRLDYCQAKSMQLSEFTSQSEFFLERFLLKQLVMVDQNIVSLFIVFDTGRYSLCTYFFVKCQVEEMSGRASVILLQLFSNLSLFQDVLSQAFSIRYTVPQETLLCDLFCSENQDFVEAIATGNSKK